jgi:hypothetical protein
MSTDHQRDTFERTGLLRLPGAVPAAEAAAMRDGVWEFLARRDGVAPDRPETWTEGIPRHLQPLRRSGLFAGMASAVVRAALDGLLGDGGWREPSSWGQPLVTFPCHTSGGTEWTVPAEGWHVDSFGAEPGLPGVTVFVFLVPVAARGGGTVVVPGSHRLVNAQIVAGRWRSGGLKAALGGESAWLSGLWRPRPDDPRGSRRVARYLDEGTVIGGERYRVEELTGMPGDAVLMHPRTLHAPAPNIRETARMMLLEFIWRR